MINAPMLTTLEQHLQVAAGSGKINVFNRNLEMIKKLNGGKIPAEVLKRVFFDPQRNVFKGIIMNPAETSPGFVVSPDSATAKIVLSLLQEMHKAKISLSEALKGASYYYGMSSFQDPFAITVNGVGNGFTVDATMTQGTPSVNSWASKHDLAEILAHPLVERELVISQIQDLFLENKIKQARKLLDNYREEYHLTDKEVFSPIPQRIQAIGAVMDPQIKDSIYEDLLDYNCVSIHDLVASSNLRTFVDTVFQGRLRKTQDTNAYRAIHAALSVEMEPAPAQNTPKAIKLIERHLETLQDPQQRAQFCADLLSHLLQDSSYTMQPQPPGQIDAKRQICALLVKQANSQKKSLAAKTPAEWHTMITRLSVMDNEQHEFFKDPSILSGLKSDDAIPGPAMKPANHAVISDLLHSFFIPIHVPSPINSSYFDAIRCVSKNSAAGFTLQDLIPKLKPQPTDPNAPTYQTEQQISEYYDKFIAILIKDGLVTNMESLEPGAFQTMPPLIDPATNLPYDLYDYFQQNPTLYGAYEKWLRDFELPDEYALIKAIESGYTEKELAELKRVDEQEEKIEHGGHQYSLGAIRDFMRANEDVADSILERVGNSQKGDEARLKQVYGLRRVARNFNKSSQEGSTQKGAEGATHSQQQQVPEGEQNKRKPGPSSK